MAMLCRVLLLAVGASGFFEGMKRQGLVKKAESLALERYGGSRVWKQGLSELERESLKSDELERASLSSVCCCACVSSFRKKHECSRA